MTWPTVFDGIGALVVRCDLDPAELVAKIRRHTPSLTWIAPKVNGTDITGPADIAHAVAVWRRLGLSVGQWAYCDGPPEADTAAALRHDGWPLPEFLIFDVEAEYKRDEGGHFEWAAELVGRFEPNGTYKGRVAVTSYGAYKTSIDFGAFAGAGWPIIAQAYDSFTVPDAVTYTKLKGGPYDAAGVHTMVRSLKLVTGQAVYRPEGIDG